MGFVTQPAQVVASKMLIEIQIAIIKRFMMSSVSYFLL
jgi:hypothetical protein